MNLLPISRYRLKFKHRTWDYNTRELKGRAIAAHEMISLWQDGAERRVSGFKLVAYDIPDGNVAAYYPETNPLVPLHSTGDDSHTPTSKSIAVLIRRQASQRIL